MKTINTSEQMTINYKTIRTNREYKITMSDIGLYAGTYILDATVTDISNTVAKCLNFDNTSGDYHPDELDFDHSELTAYALLYLTQHNRDLVSVEIV